MKTKLLVIACVATFLSALMLVVSSCGGDSAKNLFDQKGDVGAVKFPGGVAFDAATRTYTLTGSGTNMWGPADEFFMIWRSVTGDFELSSDIAFEGAGVNAHRKIGLIVRDGLSPAAAYADVAVHGDGLVSLQYRPTQGAETQEVIGQPSGSVIPARISLARRGNKLTMRISGRKAEMSDFEKGRADARDWLYGEDNEVTLELPETCSVGLFICSHDGEVVETGRFSNVVLSI